MLIGMSRVRFPIRLFTNMANSVKTLAVSSAEKRSNVLWRSYVGYYVISCINYIVICSWKRRTSQQAMLWFIILRDKVENFSSSQ